MTIMIIIIVTTNVLYKYIGNTILFVYNMTSSMPRVRHTETKKKCILAPNDGKKTPSYYNKNNERKLREIKNTIFYWPNRFFFFKRKTYSQQTQSHRPYD